MDEDSESWIIVDRIYDCKHGVIDLHQTKGDLAHCYVYLDPKVMDKLDPVMCKQFVQAASKVVSREHGQNGIKVIGNNIEIKIDSDLRLVASAKYQNINGNKLIIFDSMPINHKMVSRIKTSLKETTDIPIVIHHNTIDDLIAEFTHQAHVAEQEDVQVSLIGSD